MLVLAPSDRRLESLRRATAGITARIFWFAQLGHVSDVKMFAPPWLHPTGDAPNPYSSNRNEVLRPMRNHDGGRPTLLQPVRAHVRPKAVPAPPRQPPRRGSLLAVRGPGALDAPAEDSGGAQALSDSRSPGPRTAPLLCSARARPGSVRAGTAIVHRLRDSPCRPVGIMDTAPIQGWGFAYLRHVSVVSPVAILTVNAKAICCELKSLVLIEYTLECWAVPRMQ